MELAGNAVGEQRCERYNMYYWLKYLLLGFKISAPCTNQELINRELLLSYS